MNTGSNPPRLPVPLWLWLVFIVCPPFLTRMLCLHYDVSAAFTYWGLQTDGFLPGHERNDPPAQAALALGWLLAPASNVCFAGGLALAGRCFRGTAARILGGVVFAAVVAVAVAAVWCAGCVCNALTKSHG